MGFTLWVSSIPLKGLRSGWTVEEDGDSFCLKKNSATFIDAMLNIRIMPADVTVRSRRHMPAIAAVTCPLPIACGQLIPDPPPEAVSLFVGSARCGRAACSSARARAVAAAAVADFLGRLRARAARHDR